MEDLCGIVARKWGGWVVGRFHLATLAVKEVNEGVKSHCRASR